MKDIFKGTIILLTMFLVVGFSGCTSLHRADGWYPVADIPENMIEGKAIATTKDFEKCILDSVSYPDMIVIVGILKEDKIRKFAEASENRIGKRIGFVYKDSVIMAPTVHCRIESGTFTINSYDRELILEIFNSLNK